MIFYRPEENSNSELDLIFYLLSSLFGSCYGLYHCLEDTFVFFLLFVHTMFVLHHLADYCLGPHRGYCQEKKRGKGERNVFPVLWLGSVSYLVLNLPWMLHSFTEAPIGNIKLTVLRIGVALFLSDCYFLSPACLLTTLALFPPPIFSLD